METITQTLYRCSICEHSYHSEEDALGCENKKVTGDKGVGKGDKIKVLSGEGKGRTGTVESIHIKDMHWGHYAWKRYWHTIAIVAKFTGGGVRCLTFDDYEPITD